MSDVYSTWKDMRTVRDELALHLHLATMEARSRWNALQPRLARFESAVIKVGEQFGANVEREAAALSRALRSLRDELVPRRALAVNELPRYDASVNTTGCCPQFSPDGWDRREVRFVDKLAVRATTHSEQHVPTDMGAVFSRTFGAIRAAGAADPTDFLVLSHDVSASETEHFFAVSRDVPGEAMVRLNGTFMTRVFDGPFADQPTWTTTLVEELQRRGRPVRDVYWFYTTCPSCAAAYGHNYVVAFARVDP